MIAARTRILLFTITLLTSISAIAGANDALDRAKDLYRGASYDEALALLDDLSNSALAADRHEAGVYRLFCLVALARRADAQSLAEAMVGADPFYQLPEDEAPPRVRALFNAVRRAVLPAIVQREYAEAKSALDRKDAQAAMRFGRVLTLLDDPTVAALPAMTDLRTVVVAFRDLSSAVAERAATTVPPVAVSAPMATGRPSAAVARAAFREGDQGVTPPIPIKQTLPPWVRPRSLPSGQREWEGTLEVAIDDKGGVTSARLMKPIHPTYDAQLTRAALSWTYSPATKDGTPVRFTRLMSIRLGAGD